MESGVDINKSALQASRIRYSRRQMTRLIELSGDAWTEPAIGGDISLADKVQVS